MGAQERSWKERAAFVRDNPCPATGLRRGACPGWEVDHRIPIACGGPDSSENMQWLSVHEHRKKTLTDNRNCRRRPKRP